MHKQGVDTSVDKDAGGDSDSKLMSLKKFNPSSVIPENPYDPSLSDKSDKNIQNSAITKKTVRINTQQSSVILFVFYSIKIECLRLGKPKGFL